MAFKKFSLIRDYDWGMYPYIEFYRHENGNIYIHVAIDEHNTFDVVDTPQNAKDILLGYAEMFSLAAKHAREQQG